MKRTVLLLSILLLSSCSSNVYSPFMQLPTRPLEQDRGELVAGAGVYPYTHPGFYYAVGGGELAARYALTNNVTLQGRTWAQESWITQGHINGVSLEGIIMLSDTTKAYRYAVVPRALLLTNYNEIAGWATQFSAAVWTPKFLGLDPYLGLGAIYGNESTDNDHGGRNIYAGVGAVANLGLSYPLSNAFHLHGEAAYSLIYNTYDNKAYWMIVPQLALSYRF